MKPKHFLAAVALLIQSALCAQEAIFYPMPVTHSRMTEIIIPPAQLYRIIQKTPEGTLCARVVMRFPRVHQKDMDSTSMAKLEKHYLQTIAIPFFQQMQQDSDTDATYQLSDSVRRRLNMGDHSGDGILMSHCKREQFETFAQNMLHGAEEKDESANLQSTSVVAENISSEEVMKHIEDYLMRTDPERTKKTDWQKILLERQQKQTDGTPWYAKPLN